MYYVYLATESMVLDHLEENGFHVQYMPPTKKERTRFQQMYATSKFFTEKLDKIDNGVFLEAEALTETLVILDNSFADFQMISDALVILRRYILAENFLEQLNNNTWRVIEV